MTVAYTDDEPRSAYIPDEELITTYGLNPLAILCYRNGFDCLETVKTMNPTPDDINHKCSYDMTPFLYACDNNNIPLVQWLIEQGADVSQTSETGFGALHGVASTFGDEGIELAKILIAAGCDVNASDEYGDTPLHVACISSSKSGASLLIQFLLQQGANPDSRSKKKTTPLHEACAGYDVIREVNVIKALLDGGAPVNAIDSKGMTPLMLVCRHFRTYNIGVVNLLLKRGADIEIKDRDGFTPVSNVLQEYHYEKRD